MIRRRRILERSEYAGFNLKGERVNSLDAEELTLGVVWSWRVLIRAGNGSADKYVVLVQY